MACVWIYCQNVRLKLGLLIPEIKVDYDSYSHIICTKLKGQKCRNQQWIFKIHEKCKGWETTIRSLLTSGSDLTRIITWQSCVMLPFFAFINKNDNVNSF